MLQFVHASKCERGCGLGKVKSLLAHRHKSEGEGLMKAKARTSDLDRKAQSSETRNHMLTRSILEKKSETKLSNRNTRDVIES